MRICVLDASTQVASVAMMEDGKLVQFGETLDVFS